MNERRHYAIGQSPTVYSEKSIFADLTRANEIKSFVIYLAGSGAWHVMHEAQEI